MILHVRFPTGTSASLRDIDPGLKHSPELHQHTDLLALNMMLSV